MPSLSRCSLSYSSFGRPVFSASLRARKHRENVMTKVFKFVDRGTWLFLGAAVAVFVVVQMLLSLGVLNDFWSNIIRQGAVMAILALGLNLIYGFNGQFSLGQFGFYAIGAYASADVTFRWTQAQTANGLTVLFMVVLLVGVAILGLQRLLARIRGLDILSAFALYLALTIVATVV